MSRLISLSRAARLVGVKRATLQKKVRDGELDTFEGQIVLSDLLHAYPQTRVEDTTMLDRVEQIMEQAVDKVYEPKSRPDPKTLAARIMVLGRELAISRAREQRTSRLLEQVLERLNGLDPADETGLRIALGELKHWLYSAAVSQDADESQELLAKEAFLRVMAAQIRILPSGDEFLIQGSDTILEAGLRTGLSLNYGCSNGNCGLCKAQVVSGEVRKIRPHDYVISESEQAIGYILMCANTAVTDVVLEADVAGSARDIPYQEIAVTVKRIDCPADDVMILSLKTPRTKRLRFLAGQRLNVEMEGLSAEVPIASCPCDDRNIQLHLPRLPDNPFSDHAFTALRPADVITIKGPYGEFTLREDSPRSVVFIACDTGFGPVKSLIEHAMALDEAETLYLFWMTSPGAKAYEENLCRSWDDALDNFRYTHLQMTGELPDEDLLHGIVADLGTLGAYDVYVAGPHRVVDRITQYLVVDGLPRKQLSVLPLDTAPAPA
jgi:CDP-4-dehydro-6-deoxyglucose reductase